MCRNVPSFDVLLKNWGRNCNNRAHPKTKKRNCLISRENNTTFSQLKSLNACGLQHCVEQPHRSIPIQIHQNTKIALGNLIINGCKDLRVYFKKVTLLSFVRVQPNPAGIVPRPRRNRQDALLVWYAVIKIRDEPQSPLLQQYHATW